MKSLAGELTENERYKKSYSNRTLYIAAEIAMGITAFYINMLNFAILNLLIWFVGVGVTVYFLYYEDADRPIRRITECEVLVLCMSVCETLGESRLIYSFSYPGNISLALLLSDKRSSTACLDRGT